MGVLTEAQARFEMSQMSLEELIILAQEQGIPTADTSKHDIIERLLGNCSGCKKKE